MLVFGVCVSLRKKTPNYREGSLNLHRKRSAKLGSQVPMAPIDINEAQQDLGTSLRIVYAGSLTVALQGYARLHVDGYDLNKCDIFHFKR